MIRFVCTMIFASLASSTCFAWSEGGHHLIAVMAYDMLKLEQQVELLTILKSHPRFNEDFAPRLKKIDDPAESEHYLIGRAAYWPDVARSQPDYDRYSWHYQLGATLVLGNPRRVPSNPGPVPGDATLETKELHIAQAVQLCCKIYLDKSRPAADRALCVCWLAHLVGDAHQPCHAGSLYSKIAFPDGDRGASILPTKQVKHLHGLWDQLLGPTFDAGDVHRRHRELIADSRLMHAANEAACKPDGLDPLTWLSESSAYGRSHVYTHEVLEPIEAVERGLARQVEPVDIPEAYFKAAGQLARERAAFAAFRLAAILKQGI